jgi:hypothetical protein
MNLFVTNNADAVQDCVESGLAGRGQLAFVCENSDEEPILIVFAEHYQRYDLAGILRATAEGLPQAIPDYDRDI